MQNEHESESTPLGRRQRAKTRTRKKVLDAACDLFMCDGYEKATIRDIAARAGMSTGAVFANFEDKSDLLLVVAERELESHEALLREAAEGEGTVLDRIVRVCTADFAFFSEQLHILEALAFFETDPSPQKNRKARRLVDKRRKNLQRIIDVQLRTSRCENVSEFSMFLSYTHTMRCRQLAVLDWNVDLYRQDIREAFSPLLL